jgi:hypothetical protein
MKEFKGTKGDWEIDYSRILGGDCEIVSIEVSNTDSKKVCNIWKKDAHRNDQNQDYSTSKANAKLIAAAPDLLEALQEMVLVFNRDDNDNAQHIRVGNAEKAIEKALN